MASNTLRGTPHGVFSWNFTVSEKGIAIAEIGMSWWAEQADVFVSGAAYRVQREGWLNPVFSLQSGDRVLARATKPSAFFRTFDVELPGGRLLVLKAVSAFSRAFVLAEGGQTIGSIAPATWFGRTADIVLPDDIGLAEQVFLFWLVVVLWRRASRSPPAPVT